MIIQQVGKLKVANGHYKGYAIGGYGKTNVEALNGAFAEIDYLAKLDE